MKALRPLFMLLMLPVVLLGTGTVGAASSTPTTCSGTFASPGIIAAGTYSSLNIKGVCLMPGGTVIVQKDVTVGEGAALLGNFPPSPGHPEGDATIIIKGNVFVGENAALFLGCSPHAGCKNTTSDVVKGSVETDHALGIILHNDIIGGELEIHDGGGGVNCTPSGIFANIKSPVFSDVEDNVIGGSLNVAGMKSCYFGEFRNTVMGNDTVDHNTYADPDATEVGTNTVLGNLSCFDNAPAAQFGDSGAAPNTVLGKATGECAALI